MKALILLIGVCFFITSCEQPSEITSPIENPAFTGFWQGENFGIHSKFVCSEINGQIIGRGFLCDGDIGNESFIKLTGSHSSSKISITIFASPAPFTFEGYFEDDSTVFGQISPDGLKKLAYIWRKKPMPKDFDK